MSVPDPILRGRHPDTLERAERRELISAYLDGELPADEARIVTHWLDENPDALREVEHVRRTWDLLDQYEDEPVPAGFAGRVFDEVGIERPEKAGRRIPVAFGLIAAAASVLIAIGLGLVAMSGDESTPPSEEMGAARILDTVPDELVEQLDLLADFGSDDFEASLIDYADFDAEGQDG